MNHLPAGISFEVDGSETFSVRDLSVEDGLSSLFQVSVVAMCGNPAIDFEAIIGRDAKLRLEMQSGQVGGAGERVWSGIVAEVNQLGDEEDGLSTYALSVVPKLWLLSQRTNCRVFQQMTDLDIALSLLAEWQIEPDVRCQRSQKTRKYRVQYHESDYAFLCRLLEASGVTFLFRQEGDTSRLVLDDQPEKAKERSERLVHQGEPVLGTLWASGLSASRRMRHGKVTFADHDHRRANEPLLGEAIASAHPLEARLERFQYTPGAFRFGNRGPADTPHADDRGRTRTDTDEAARIAGQTASALIARSQRLSFRSNALDLSPGTVLTMQGNARAERHGKLLITRVVTTGAFNEEPVVVAHAVGAAEPYRPEAKTESPVVQGVECATVVGPSGETIHCDEFGRVRVQFHWDRYGQHDQDSSCWIHVNQAWAGDGLGSLSVPRVGQEVIVGFLGGDPEEPIVVGRIFTHMTRPPLPLPANKTQNGFRSASVPATGGYNEMMFDDAAGSEAIRMRAERDYKTLVNNDAETTIGNKRTTHVESDDKETVGGNMMQSVLGQLTQTVASDAISQVLSNAASFVGGHRVMGTTGNLTSSAAMHTMSSQQATLLQVGASTIYIGPDGVIIQSPKVLLNPGEGVLATAVLTGSIPSAESPAS